MSTSDQAGHVWPGGLTLAIAPGTLCSNLITALVRETLEAMGTGTPVLDEQDRKIIRIRRKSLNTTEFPRVGDWVEFSDCTYKRITAVYAEGYEEKDRHVNTGQAEFYLGFGFVCSMNCRCEEEIPFNKLWPEPRTNFADVYIYHHDEHKPENKIGALIPVRIWWCSK